MKNVIPEVADVEMVWADKKRFLGMPLTFTKYSISDDRFFEKRGLLNTVEEEILLYRVRDISLKRTIFQKIFGVGSIILKTVDSSTPEVVIKNIKYPGKVKELLFRSVEQQKEKRGIRVGEILDDDD